MRVRFGAGVDKWLSRLPALVHACAQRWQLVPTSVAVAGSTSVIIRCDAPARPVVLKLTPDPVLAVQEGRALGLWAEAVHVVDVLDVDGDLGAVVLEAVAPGEPLSQEGRWSLTEVAPLLAEIFTMTVPTEMPGSVPSLVDRVEFLFGLTRHRLAPNGAALARLPASLLSEGAARSLELATSPGSADGLVHGDLHPGNVLRAHGRRGLVAIDPRACIGDRLFDLVDWVLTRDVADHDALDRRLADLEARIPGVDGDRLRLWVVALAGLVAAPLLQRGIEPHRARFLADLAET